MATTFLEAGTDSTFDFSLWNQNTASTGTLTSDTTNVQDGIRAIKCHTASTGDTASVFTNNSIVADAGTRISAWFYFSTATPSVLTQFMSPETSSNGSLIFGLGLNTNGKLLLGARGSTQLNGTTTLSANTWYRISMVYVLTSTSNYTCKVFINGSLEISMTQANGNAGLTGSSCCTFGQNTSSQNGFTSTAAMDIWVDSVYIDSSSALTDPGNIHLTAKRPFSNGTTNGFTTQIGSGGSGYGSGHAPQVNERPLSTTNGWSMVGAGSAVTEEYTIESASSGDIDISTATIVDFMGWVDVKALIAETGKIIVAGVSTNISVTTSASIFTKIAGSTTYPAGGTDIGVVTSTTVTTFSLYECGIVVAYIPASATTTSTSSSTSISTSSTSSSTSTSISSTSSSTSTSQSTSTSISTSSTSSSTSISQSTSTSVSSTSSSTSTTQSTSTSISISSTSSSSSTSQSTSTSQSSTSSSISTTISFTTSTSSTSSSTSTTQSTSTSFSTSSTSSSTSQSTSTSISSTSSSTSISTSSTSSSTSISTSSTSSSTSTTHSTSTSVSTSTSFSTSSTSTSTSISVSTSTSSTSTSTSFSTTQSTSTSVSSTSTSTSTTTTVVDLGFKPRGNIHKWYFGPRVDYVRGRAYSVRRRFK